MAEAHRFSAELEQARAGGAIVLIPKPVADALGGLKQMRVVGTVNGVAYQSSTMPYGGRGLFMGVHRATREAAGVGFGEMVEVVVSRDERPRILVMPRELEAALTEEPALRLRFEALSFSRRRELAQPITDAKRPETRAARLEKALAQLRRLA
ncbi:MAG TPA: YdeI/OmpD-associated family protein [Candidatus Limnocylindria bacterium]|nr:YdeI/OmpD-associated family protein [Candidatus Limnocylindria bacterium]